MNSSAHNAKNCLSISFLSRPQFCFFFSFKKGRYFTVYKRRNKRHSESQTLYLFVEAKACPSSGFSYATHEILTLCEILSFIGLNKYPALGQEADSLPAPSICRQAYRGHLFGARCASKYPALGEEADSPPCSINLPSRILSNDKTLNENRTHTRAHTHTLILQHTHIHACTHTHAHLQINYVLI